MEERFHGLENATRQLTETLIGAHHVQICVGSDPKALQHLVEHVTVLTRHRDLDIEISVKPQRADHRRELDGFGPGAKDHEHASRLLMG